jgi:hypothetical protein
MNKLLNYFFRNPSLVLTKTVDDDYEVIYLRRWWLVPKNKWFNVFLHEFRSSDEDRSLHDHPWWSISILLSGSYLEHVPTNYDKWVEENNREISIIKRDSSFPVYRSVKSIHRIEIITPTVWTLFITGPSVREWGFHCPWGWRHHNEFLDSTGKTKGKGCE